jgi:cell division protein FtsI (penicillin-binding protein 3)
LRGTGKAAHLSGYTSGGKTGTAQIFDVANHHYTKTYNASFMGFAPVNNPALVIVVTLNGTTGNSGMGGAASAPAFHVIATEALRLLDVPKDLPDDPPPAQLAKKEPVKSEEQKAEELSDLAITEVADGSTNILEEEDSAKPAAAGGAAAASDHAKIITASMPQGPVLQGPMVPDLRGKTMRAALEAASTEGFILSAEGSGVVRAQSPAPGERSRIGQNVKVRLGR